MLRRSFTLVELLATVAIIAVLSVIAGFFVVSYINWSQNLSDQRTLLVLNDALTRAKCEGAGTTAFTSGAPIANVISVLKTPVNWAGQTHQFLQSAFTVPARSVSSKGNTANYKFTQYYTYQLESGGLVNGGNNLVHGLVSFTSVATTTWTVPSGVFAVQVLVVAGGGGGSGPAGNASSGGGGAGGVIYNTSYSVTSGSGLTVTVGGGGTGNNGSNGTNGSNSVFDSLTAVGGGGGGCQNNNGLSGGSGGGGGGTSFAAGTGGSATAGQGYAGGNGITGSNGQRAAGGGGGAGAIGANATTGVGGNGGVGFSSSISGSPVYYGGGGGGGGQGSGGTGGNGGGGNAGTTGAVGTANTGGGGGGGGGVPGGIGGNGGSGIVIVSY